MKTSTFPRGSMFDTCNVFMPSTVAPEISHSLDDVSMLLLLTNARNDFAPPEALKYIFP